MDRKRRLVVQTDDDTSLLMLSIHSAVETLVQQNMGLHLQIKNLNEQMERLRHTVEHLNKEVSDLQIHALHGFNIEQQPAPYTHF